jgi:hypothetical protein
MNMFNAQGILNPTTLLLLGGLALLLLNIGYGIFRTSRNDVNAGRVTVVVVLLACSLIIIGSVQVASANSAAGALPRSQRAGAAAQVAPTQSVATTAAPSDTSATPAVSPTSSTDATVPPAAAAAGTPTKRARSGTPGAAVNNGVVRTPAAGGSSATSGSSATGAGGGSSAVSNPAANTVNNAATTTDNSAANLILILAGFAVILSAALYLIERRRPTFKQESSRGLLNLGGAVFVLIALQIIPMIPAQFNSVNTASAASARSASFPTRSVITATPTATERPTETPTLLPTFTPTPTTMPQLQPTEIAYVNAQPIATAVNAQSAALNPVTGCLVTSTNNVNLRSDPSTTNPLLLTIPAGTIFTASGRSQDKSWWRISYNSGNNVTVGWVSAQYTTNNGKCSTVPTLQQ